MAKQKELDPTRTCTYGADLANIYKGVNEVIPVRGFNYRIGRGSLSQGSSGTTDDRHGNGQHGNDTGYLC